MDYIFISTSAIATLRDIIPSGFTTLVIIPAILAVVPVYLALRVRDKLDIRLVSGLNDADFKELAGLYVNRVPDYERVPPNHFRAFFKPKYAPKSLRDFRKRVISDDVPAHLLFVARTSHGICGFLKAIYVPKIRGIFIAYLVATKGNTYEEHSVTQGLISELFASCNGSPIRSVFCEICRPPKSNYKAKVRLFRHQFQSHGLQLRRVVAPYRQPEVCSFDAGECGSTEADLYIAYIGDQTQDAWHSMRRDDYIALVSAIYKDVYLMSYMLAEPHLAEKYRDVLQRISQSLFSALRKDTVDLK